MNGIVANLSCPSRANADLILSHKQTRSMDESVLVGAQIRYVRAHHNIICLLFGWPVSVVAGSVCYEEITRQWTIFTRRPQASEYAHMDVNVIRIKRANTRMCISTRASDAVCLDFGVQRASRGVLCGLQAARDARSERFCAGR